MSSFWCALTSGRHGQRVVEVGQRGVGNWARASSTPWAAVSMASLFVGGDSGQEVVVMIEIEYW